MKLRLRFGKRIYHRPLDQNARSINFVYSRNYVEKRLDSCTHNLQIYGLLGVVLMKRGHDQVKYKLYDISTDQRRRIMSGTI